MSQVEVLLMAPGSAATMLIGSLCREYFSFCSETGHTDSNWKHKIRVTLRDRKIQRHSPKASTTYCVDLS